MGSKETSPARSSGTRRCVNCLSEFTKLGARFPKGWASHGRCGDKAVGVSRGAHLCMGRGCLRSDVSTVSRWW